MAENKNAVSTENKLDNSILLHIFRYLPIADKIKIERVNRRWNSLSKSSWNSVKKLDLDPESWGFKPHGSLLDGPKVICSAALIKVFKRCGKFLDDINLSETNETFTLNVIATYCPNVRLLTLKGNMITFNIDEGNTETLAEKYKNLVELRCINRDQLQDLRIDRELSFLFKNNKNLRNIKFFNSPTIDGSCLLDLPLLEKLDLNYKSPGFFSENIEKNLVQAIKRMKNLKVFKIHSIHFFLDDLILSLQNCSNLNELQLYVSQKYCRLEQDTNLGIIFKNNPNLKILTLNNVPGLRGECLRYFNDNCIEELRLIDLSNFDYSYLKTYFEKFKNVSKFEYFSYNINFKNYNDLTKFIPLLENLKYLKVTLLPRISGSHIIPISSFTNVEELSFISNNKISLMNDDCINKFSNCLKNLKILNLSQSRCVSDVGLYALTSLPKLEDLSLAAIDGITDKGFNEMSNLKKFKCYGCPKITNDCLNKILREAEGLDYLCVEGLSSNFKYDDLILFANEITKKRTNNIVLYIHIYYVDPSQTKLQGIKKSPFLEYTNRYYKSCPYNQPE